MFPRKMRFHVPAMLPRAIAERLAAYLPEATPTPAAEKFEARLLTAMMNRHFLSLLAADVCLGRTLHPEMEALCRNLIVRHSEEIHIAQDWLSKWYGQSHEPQLSKAGQRSLARLVRLKEAELEIAFMEMLIPHHAATITLAGRGARRTCRTALRRLCHDIVDTHSMERSVMEEWLFEWYARG